MAGRLVGSVTVLSVAWLLFLCWSLFIRGAGDASPGATFLLLGWPALLALLLAFIFGGRGAR